MVCENPTHRLPMVNPRDGILLWTCSVIAMSSNYFSNIVIHGLMIPFWFLSVQHLYCCSHSASNWSRDRILLCVCSATGISSNYFSNTVILDLMILFWFLSVQHLYCYSHSASNWLRDRILLCICSAISIISAILKYLISWSHSDFCLSNIYIAAFILPAINQGMEFCCATTVPKSLFQHLWAAFRTFWICFLYVSSGKIA